MLWSHPSLSEAEDHLQSILDGIFYLLGNDLVRLSEMGPSFRVAEDDPRDVDILNLFGCDFSCVGAIREGRAILGGYLYVLVLFSEHDGD